MNIKINPKSKVLTLTEKGKSTQYEFREILMDKTGPNWLVELKDGSILTLSF